MQSHSPPIEITLRDLEKYHAPISGWINSVNHNVVVISDTVSNAGIARRSESQEVKLSTLGHRVGKTEGKPLMDNDINHCLNVVLRGLQIGMHITELFDKYSGLETLRNENKKTGGFSSDATKNEFLQKNITAAHILRFVTSYFVVYELTGYHTDSLTDVTVEEPKFPEIDQGNATSCARTMLFYFGKALEHKSVQGSSQFVKMTIEYFQVLLKDVQAREKAGSLAYTEAFTSQTYKLTDSNFLIDGFSVDSTGVRSSEEYRPFSFDNMVGNEVAIHEALRMIDRISCYDPETSRNPFVKLAGLLQVMRLAEGFPGTGKTLMIRAVITKFKERCDFIGIPFVYHPLRASVISSYQGKSGQQMEQWFAAMNNPKILMYAAIDDAEQVLQDRTIQGTSAGQREAVSAFLTGTEGAGATWVDRGNVLCDTMTNIPDALDPAVLSRMQSRFPINGAQSEAHFVAQDWLFWSTLLDGNASLFEGVLLPDQVAIAEFRKRSSSVATLLTDAEEPNHPKMRAIYSKVIQRFPQPDIRLFGALQFAVQQNFPRFTSRETRNIHSAISARLIDFDFPSAWNDSPEVFYRQSYDTKLQMLRAAQLESTKGVGIFGVWKQEISRYLDSFANIQDKGFQREVDAEEKRQKVFLAARQRVQPQGDSH